MIYQTHSEAKAILSRLAQEKIAALYHFTSVENLPGICQMQALCSKQTLENHGRWPTPVPGGERQSHELDRKLGNWDKVSLSLTPHTPMVFHRKKEQNICFFIVRIEVATWLGVIFTDTNAAKTTNQQRAEGLVGLNYIQFKAIRATPRPWDYRGWCQPVQAEVLVPDKISLKYVSKVVFVNKRNLKYARSIFGGLTHPPFVVDTQIFS